MANAIQTVLKNEITNVDEIIRNPKEYDGRRVVTFKDIDAAHERPEGTAKRNFTENRERFIEGEDYFLITKKTLENTEKYEICTFEIPNRGLIVVTETGYLMLVKSFTDDLAWQVQRTLINSYFRRSLSSVPRLELGESTKKLIEKARKKMITLETMIDIIEGNSDRAEKEKCRNAMPIFSRGLGANILDLAQIRLDQ